MLSNSAKFGQSLGLLSLHYNIFESFSFHKTIFLIRRASTSTNLYNMNIYSLQFHLIFILMRF